MSAPVLSDVERLLRLVDRLGPRSGAIHYAFEYANRLRGWDFDEMAADWQAVVRLAEKAQTKMRG